VITFRIDGRTIKRGALIGQHDHQVSLGVGKLAYAFCNTPGVYHSLSSGFELKHDRLIGDDNVKVNLWR
jgi:hypothetical protein